MDFDWVVKNRKSVRHFLKKKPSWKHVLEAVDSALQGPFAGNHNHLKFLIVEDKDKIHDLAGFCDQGWIKEVSILVLVCSDDTHLENIYDERGRIYSRQQAGAAIQTFLLKLTDLGIDSCWVGAYSDEKVKNSLGIPRHVQIEAIIPIGFEEGNIRKEKKKALENVLFWESWGSGRRPTIFNEDTDIFPRG